jgi:hypothetical protein
VFVSDSNSWREEVMGSSRMSGCIIKFLRIPVQAPGLTCISTDGFECLDTKIGITFQYNPPNFTHTRNRKKVHIRAQSKNVAPGFKWNKFDDSHLEVDT